MGRPQDDFCWENAVKVSDSKWKCKHCNGEFSGTADRIRRHLSGQGGGIGLCKDVPPNIRDRASEEVLNKLRTNYISRINAHLFGEGSGIGLCEGDEASEEVLNKLSTINNISKRPRLSSSSVGEDYNHGIINVDRQGAIIGNTTVVAHVTQLFQGGCSSGDPNLMTQRDNDDVNVDSRGMMMSNINATINMASTTANSRPVAVQVTDPFLDAPSSSAWLNAAVGSGGVMMSNNATFDGVNLSKEREMNHMPPSQERDVAVENRSVAVQVTDPCLHAPSSSDRLNVVERRDTSTDPSLPSSSRDPNLMTGRDAELYVTDALLKFLMCRSNEYSPVDFIKDPNFRIFLERACQYGVPSSLVRGESPMIERSLLNFKDQVYQYILRVKESWKTTGFTVMLYNLNQRKPKLSTLDKGNYVLGCYSPKGFIFFEQPSLRSYPASVFGNFDATDINIIYHDYVGGAPAQLCELSEQRSSEDWTDQLHDYPFQNHSCLRNKIQRLCSKICERSEWAKGLVNKADKIHQYVADAHTHWCDYMDNKPLWKKEFKGRKRATALSRFLSVMLLEDGLKSWISCPIRYTPLEEADPEVQTTFNDSEFWVNGRALQKTINLILQIADLFDTLVPSIGYVQLAIDKVKRDLNSCNRPRTSTVNEFWHHLDELLSVLPRRDYRIEFAAYLNPVYFFGQVVQGQAFHLEKKGYFLCDLENEERKEAEEELQRYSVIRSNPFANISNEERQNTHPVKLWEKYGHGFPMLRKYAIKILRQPASCMCNQVKKHMSQLEGADDHILRLNARMMEEFTNLGDNIYNPIDLEQIVYW